MRITAFTALLALFLCLIGCGNPDEAANELFVEAVELVNKGKSKEDSDIPAAIESYEAAIIKIRKIVNEHKKSALAVRLVSGERLFTGKSMAQIEGRAQELQRELVRFEQTKRQAEKLLWEFVTGGGVRSSPAIGSDGTVYVGSNDKKLYAINGKSGVKLWEFETGGFVYSSPAIGSDGTVYVGSRDKKLYAINGKSGVKLW